jgi:hypothetical protein
MGDLIKMPLSEANATIEVLDNFGVVPDDCRKLRMAPAWWKETVARVFKIDPFLVALFEIEQSAKRVGFLESDLHALAKDEDKLRQVLELVRDSAHKIDCSEKVYSFLHPRGDVSIPRQRGIFNPANFYQTRNGLYVWEGFTTRILSIAQPTAITPVTLSSFDLIKSAHDTDVRGELPTNHVFGSASLFCGYLASLISRQPNGKTGDLIANGCANLFYVCGINSEVFTVDVSWSSDDREWDVLAHALDAYRWNAGYRAFSSN